MSSWPSGSQGMFIDGTVEYLVQDEFDVQMRQCDILSPSEIGGGDLVKMRKMLGESHSTAPLVECG